jgi:type I restriction enzyme S subunit
MTEQQLPKGWQMVKFGEIAKHISKRVEPSKTDLDLYVGLEHLDPGSLKIKRHGVPSDVAGQKLLVKKGQIIFGKRRAYQRKLGVADWDCICSAHAMVLEEISEKVVPEFLPFFMQSDVFMNRAVAISEGSLSPTIKWKVLSNQTFAIPSKKEQLNIVGFVSRVASCTGFSIKTIESMDKLYASLSNNFVLGGNSFRSLFGKDQIHIPKGWKLVRLGDILTRVQYGTSDAVHVKGGIPVLRMMNIENRRITNNDLKYSKLSMKELDSIKLYPGDILFNRTNSMEWVGKTGLFDLEGDYVFASYLLRLNVNIDLVTPEFVNRYLNLPMVQYRLKAFATPGVSQANINPTSLKALPFLLPPLDKVKMADAILSDTERTIEALKAKRDRVKNLELSIRERKLRA